MIMTHGSLSGLGVGIVVKVGRTWFCPGRLVEGVQTVGMDMTYQRARIRATA